MAIVLENDENCFAYRIFLPSVFGSSRYTDMSENFGAVFRCISLLQIQQDVLTIMIFVAFGLPRVNVIKI